MLSLLQNSSKSLAPTLLVGEPTSDVGFASRWLLVFLSAALTGLLFAGPLFFIERAAEKQGLTFLASQYTTETNELEMDLPRAREIYDGHWPPSELFSDARHLSPLNPLPVLLLAVPIWLSGGDINSAYLLNQLIFGAMMFLVFYFLGLMITRKFLWSWFFGFLGALTPLARYLPRGVSSPEYFMNLVVKNFFPLVNSSLDTLFLHKVIDPLISFIFYIPAIGFLIWFWQVPTKKTAIYSAISLGLLFYVYWHYWVYLLAVMMVLFVCAFLQKRVEPYRWQAMKYFFAVLALVALPYFINYFAFNRTDVAEVVVERYGVIEAGRWLQTNRMGADYIFYIASSVLVYLIFWRGRSANSGHRSAAILFWAFNLAAFGVWNMQLITGFNLTANHWWLSYAPIGLVILFSLVYILTEQWLKNKKVLAAILITLTLLLVIKKIVNVFIFMVPTEELIKKYSFNPDVISVWTEIGKIAGEPKVISPVLMDSVYLTIYTSARPYLPFYTNTLVSDFELEDRFLKSQKLFAVSRSNLEKQLRWAQLPSGCEKLAAHFQVRDLNCDSHTRFSFENGRFLYGFTYLPDNYSTVKKVKARWDIPEEKIQDLLKRYDSLRVSWKDIPADYVYLSSMGRNLSGKPLQYEKDLELLYKNSSSELYRIKR